MLVLKHWLLVPVLLVRRVWPCFYVFQSRWVVVGSSKSLESCKIIDYDDNVGYGTHGATYGGTRFSNKQQGKDNSSPIQQELASEENDDFATTSKN
jgi:hypothetical protein